MIEVNAGVKMVFYIILKGLAWFGGTSKRNSVQPVHAALAGRRGVISEI